MELEQLRSAFPAVGGVAEAESVDAAVALVQQRMETDSALIAAQDGLLTELRGKVEELTASVAGLEPRAQRGDAWMSDLIEQTVAARVRMQGTDFDAEMYRGKLRQLNDVDYIRGELASWEKLTADKFTAGRQIGRQPQTPKTPETKRNPAQHRA